jgi:hypothetical protein
VTPSPPVHPGDAHPGWSPVGCAVIGCGSVAHEYLDTLTASPWVTVVVCCDLDPARAAATGAAHTVAHTADLPAVLADPRVRLVVNLTPPGAHAEVAFGRSPRASRSTTRNLSPSTPPTPPDSSPKPAAGARWSAAHRTSSPRPRTPRVRRSTPA